MVCSTVLLPENKEYFSNVVLLVSWFEGQMSEEGHDMWFVVKKQVCHAVEEG
jgi:hypothetical protein